MRQELFSKKLKTMENIPPTQVKTKLYIIITISAAVIFLFLVFQAVLLQHCNRIKYLGYQSSESAKCSIT